MRFFQCTLIVLLASVLNSCGLVKTAYNNAPSLISWWLDDYLDFTQAQTAVLNPALIELHHWHRQTQLPQYISLMQALQATLAQDEITADIACDNLARIKTNLTALQLQAAPILLALAPMLNEQQHSYLKQKLAQRTQKWKKEWWPERTEDQIAVRLEKAEESAEKVYGRLTEAQRNWLKESISTGAIQPELTYQEILRRNDDIQQLMRALQDSTLTNAQKTQLVKAGIARFQLSPNPIYANYAEQTMRRTCEMIAQLHQLTNAQQKQHAHDWLASYISQFSALAATTLAAKS